MMEHGARSLGSAFQKINFLRDIEEDTHVLGRNYFPQLTGELTDATKALLVADIRTDLAAAYCCIPLLPFDARVGVQAAADLFTALTDRIHESSAVEVTHTRIRIPKAQKIAIITRAPWRALHG